MEKPIRTTLSRRTMMLSLASLAAALPARAKVGYVEIGVTGSNDDFAKADKFGFDYYEPSAMAIAALSDSAFADFRQRVLASRIRCKYVNHFMGGPELMVVGPKVNQDYVTNYVASTMDRIRQLGTEIVVYGSPGTHKVPAGFSRDHAWQQCKEFLQCAGDIAQSKNLLIAIEPCNQNETNMLNTGTETLRMLRELNHPNVKMIIDVRHMRAEKEDPEIVRTAGGQLVHFHFSSPTGGWPKSPDEDPDYGRLFGYIKEIYFHHGISIEARGTFEEDATASLAFFRKMLS